MNPFEQRKADKLARKRAAADKLATAGHATYDAADASLSAIPFGQPIIGHADLNRRQKAIKRLRSGLAKLDEAQAIHEQADRAEQSTAVSSDDPDGVAKLKAQLAEETARADAITASIKLVRKVPEPWTAANLAAAGVCPEVANHCLVMRMVPHYNNARANARRLAERIAGLEAKAAAPVPVGEQIGPATIHEDREANRVLVTFPSRISKEQHGAMRSAGFVWARTQGAYSRKASTGAWHAAREALRAMFGAVKE